MSGIMCDCCDNLAGQIGVQPRGDSTLLCRGCARHRGADPATLERDHEDPEWMARRHER